MRRHLTDRQEVLPALAEVFREHGFEGASLARIAQATGLGKGSLYHYFPGGKTEMAAAVLAEIDAWFEGHVFTSLRRYAACRIPTVRSERCLNPLGGTSRAGGACVWSDCLPLEMSAARSRGRCALISGAGFTRSPRRWFAVALHRPALPTSLRTPSRQSRGQSSWPALEDPSVFQRAGSRVRERLRLMRCQGAVPAMGPPGRLRRHPQL